MQTEDFHNGEKLNMSTSMALFTIVMGFLFWESASGGVSAIAAQVLILFGFIWYFGDHFYHWWEHHYHHH